MLYNTVFLPGGPSLPMAGPGGLPGGLAGGVGASASGLDSKNSDSEASCQCCSVSATVRNSDDVSHVTLSHESESAVTRHYLAALI